MVGISLVGMLEDYNNWSMDLTLCVGFPLSFKKVEENAFISLCYTRYKNNIGALETLCFSILVIFLSLMKVLHTSLLIGILPNFQGLVQILFVQSMGHFLLKF